LCSKVEWKKVVRKKRKFREGTGLFIPKGGAAAPETTHTETERPRDPSREWEASRGVIHSRENLHDF
jgi:hypothetical protein